MNIVTIVGARPQFVKAAALSRVLRTSPDIQERLVHTGQHYDDNLSGVFFRELDIPVPDYNLDIGSGSHGLQTGRMLERIEEILLDHRPDWMLVYGDTNSTLAGALAASKLHIPIAHVEAGLRSFNKRMPEETNRILTDHISDILFAPTEQALRNLQREGIDDSKIRVVGDVMQDVFQYYASRPIHGENIVDSWKLTGGPYILATVHRAENVDDPERLRQVFNGLASLGRKWEVILPLHPRTKAAMNRLELTPPENVRMIDPVGYLDMLQLQKNAAAIVTDSGGVQKEAFFAQVPCLTLRDETEWVELVDAGWNRLVSATEMLQLDSIVEEFVELPRKDAPQLYGGGNATNRICEALIELQRP